VGRQLPHLQLSQRRRVRRRSAFAHHSGLPLRARNVRILTRGRVHRRERRSGSVLSPIKVGGADSLVERVELPSRQSGLERRAAGKDIDLTHVKRFLFGKRPNVASGVGTALVLRVDSGTLSHYLSCPVEGIKAEYLGVWTSRGMTFPIEAG